MRRLAAERRWFEYLAYTDELTGVCNRRGLQRDLAQRLESPGPGCSFAVVDVDAFNSINTIHGRSVGDEILRQVARILEGCQPQGAVLDDLQIARLGGDEFAIVTNDVDTLLDWALGVLGATRSMDWTVAGTNLDVTVSIGLVVDRTRDIWAASTDALRIAKQQGGDQLVIHDDISPPMVAHMADRNWSSELRAALRDSDLVLHAQPIVELNKLDAPANWFEVLVRYRSPSGVLVSPDIFLPVADRVGLLGDVDMWVVSRAVEWLARNRDGTRLAVNVSPQFFSLPRALWHLGRCLDETGVDPSRLCLEITEGAAIADLARCQKVIAQMRRWGCSVAIDDFGSGWTSLPVARDLGVDILKIDGAWVRQCVRDQLSNAVVTSIVEVASILNADVVAEWVEDRETLDYLSWLGVRFAQGFLLGMPGPLDDCTSQAARCDSGRNVVRDR